MAREEQEKRKRMEGQRQKDELSKKEKVHQRKAKEFEQKTKKQKVGKLIRAISLVPRLYTPQLFPHIHVLPAYFTYLLCAKTAEPGNEATVFLLH